jgi:DUF2075 family protein
MSQRDTRKERETRAGEVAPAPADTVVARCNARIAWLERELTNVPAWREELEMLKRMRHAAKTPAEQAADLEYERLSGNG